MKKIMIPILLTIILCIPATATYVEEEQNIFTFLAGMGIEENSVKVTEDTTTIDYVIPMLSGENDLIFQQQAAYIAAAKFSPHTTLTVVRARENAEEKPKLVTTIPTPITIMYLANDIDITTMWANIIEKEPSQKLGGLGSPSFTTMLIIALLIVGIYLFFKRKKK